MILGDKSHHKHVLKINSIKVEASDNVLLLGTTIDKKNLLNNMSESAA